MGANWIADDHTLIACFVSYEKWAQNGKYLNNTHLPCNAYANMSTSPIWLVLLASHLFMSGMWIDVAPRMDIKNTRFQKK